MTVTVYAVRLNDADPRMYGVRVVRRVGGRPQHWLFHESGEALAFARTFYAVVLA